MRTTTATAILVLVITAQAGFAQEVVRLYSGPAPGSEEWTHEEQEFFSPLFNTEVVTNVAQPTLTIYKPDPQLANGTAVVVCPGGGFHALSINSEGIDVAKWLTGKGVTAAVLRYRLVPTGKDGVAELFTKGRQKVDEDMREVFPLALADTVASIAYLRQRADELGISSSRIGLMGFSAGGSLTAAVALGYTAEHRPDFVAPIYAYLGVIGEGDVPDDAPPLFVAAASDDQLGLAPDSIDLYSKWLAAKKPAEIHIFSKGGHGFGMRKQGLPTDQWIERFGQWLEVQGLLAKRE